ncbi:rho GTPase-activating protein 25-like isoform X2 [Stegostoma tigrinum]|nr:rho GTPase-activating protein 25-like isoform X2 [Stegostoma tigrinum]
MPGDHCTVSNRSSSPNTLERPAKSGWLKKRRSLVKQWHVRWFVLRGVYLCYHKEEEDGKPQGHIVLQDCKVNELPPNPDEPGKFLFEIVPVGYGDRERTGSAQESHMLMANSQSEMEDWVKVIRRAMGTLSSGAVFGQRLAETVAYEQKFGQHLVPMVVEQCADFIRNYGLNEEGIFRLPGQDNQVKELRDAFDSGERPTFDRNTDVHTVASLFKLYLRELPEPVVPWSQYEDFLACSQLMNSDEEQGQQEVMKQISFLPQANYNLLSYICRFLYEVQLSSKINKMSVDNLATVIGVNLLRPKLEDPVAIMRGNPQIQKLMTVLISKHDELFPKYKDKPPSPSLRTSAQRSMVGWGAVDPLTGTTARTHKTSPQDERDLSKAEDQLENWNDSPRKRTQTLPVQKCAGASNGSEVSLSSAELWKWSKTSQLRNGQELLTERHRHSFSQDTRQEEASCQFQLSPPSDVPIPAAASAGNSQDQERRGCRLAATSPGEETQSHQPGHSTPNLTELESQGEGQGIVNIGELGTELDKLRKDFDGKRKEYEERIQSLEKENYEVWAKVVRLSEQLELGKKQCEALEIRLQNANRAREEAEKRNRLLEQELTNFFQKNKGE